MTISPLGAWFSDPDTSAAQKALCAAVTLTFFCLPLGTSPATIAGGLALAVWLFSGLALKNRRIYREPYWWPVLVLMVLPWIGLLWSPDETGLGLDYAAKTYYWLLAPCVAAICFRHFPTTRLIQGFMLGLGLNVCAAIVQMAFFLPDRHNAYRGLGPDYSTLSAYLIVGIMMGIYFLHHAHRPKVKGLWIAIIGLYFFHLVVLQSRASYVAAVLLAPVMGYTLFHTRKLLKTAVLCLLIPALMMLSPVVRERITLTVAQLQFHMYSDDEAAWGRKYSVQQDRFYMWHGALNIIQNNPWFGVGTGGYQTVLKESDTDPAAPLIAHPHNNFLYMAVSFGAVGVAVFIWFLYVTLLNGWRQRHTPAGYMLSAVILVMLASGLFNTQIIDVGTAFLIALVVGFQSGFQRAPT